MHGQHDMNTKVLHDQTSSVGNNRSASVSGSDSESVGGSQSVSIGGGQSVTVAKKDADLTVAKGARHVNVPINTYELNAKMIHESGQDEIQLRVGASSLFMTPDAIVLGNGTSFIQIDAGGIVIWGQPLVTIN
jgi:type VI secretion system secreted protein VgrG